ncbi:MAG: polysaccharide biosynthesis protein [Wolinella sp.]
MSSPLLRPSNTKRILFFLVIDLLISYFTLSLAYNLRFSFEVPLEFNASVKLLFLVLIGLKIIALGIFRVYFVAWRFFGLVEALRILYAHLLAYGLFFVLMHFQPEMFAHFPQSVIATDFVLSVIFIGAIRISKRVYLENVREHSPKVALIFGGSTQATNLIKSALSGEIPIYPIAIIDNNPKIEGTYIANLRVYPMSSCKALIEKHKISTVVLTKEYAKPPLEKLFKEIHALGITDIKIATTLKDDEPLKDVSIEDLLSRPPKDLDRSVIKDFIFNKRVLITGGGGSIGSEIARQCVEFGASRVVLLDHSEFNLYTITEELQGYNVSSVMFSILEKERLLELFNNERPDILLHAAAYKHVPLCEDNMESAVENNVLGSKNVIDCAIMCSIPKVVIISTDKAVRPTNVMGATKRAVELYAQNVDSKDSEIVAVRFGNVLGSSGSVVPKFKAQIERGGPITVTHPEITRYFMLIPEACRLVLQAAAIARGGEIFILDMGAPVKIVDLAKNMLKLYKKEDEIQIAFTGLRPGEKLYEELLIDDSEQKTQYESIHVARPTPYDIDELNHDISELLLMKDKVVGLKKIVAEFNHKVG